MKKEIKETAHRIMNADTEYDAEMMLKVLLAQEIQKWVKEILEKLPNEKGINPEIDLEKAKTPYVIRMLAEQKGFNQALAEIKKIIKSNKLKR